MFAFLSPQCGVLTVCHHFDCSLFQWDSKYLELGGNCVVCDLLVFVAVVVWVFLLFFVCFALTVSRFFFFSLFVLTLLHCSMLT